MKFQFLIYIMCMTYIWACSMDDSKRCQEGYTYSEGICFLKEKAEDDSSGDTDVDNGDEPHSGDDTEDTTIGMECQSDDDCTGSSADYCAKMPGDPTGGCMISGCSSHSDCTEDYNCCVFMNGLGIPALCLPSSDYEQYGSFCTNEE